MAAIGFIGLGIMGRPMCGNLPKAGHKLTVYNRTPAPVERLVALGATRGESARDVASKSDVIITMLPDGPEVEQVILGAAGVLEGAAPASTVIDMSSINPLVAQKIGNACATCGVHFLDAPVSGGEPKAIDGTLAIMVGGRGESISRDGANLASTRLACYSNGRHGCRQLHQTCKPDYCGLQYSGDGRSTGSSNASRPQSGDGVQRHKKRRGWKRRPQCQCSDGDQAKL